MPDQEIALVDAWRVPEAAEFFRNVWPLYLHELSGFGVKFYALDRNGRWLPDLLEDWGGSVTPSQNLREARADDDPAQPFQRAHVISCDQRPVGFACVGMQPFKYMAPDAERIMAEFFLIHTARGHGIAVGAAALLLQRYPGRWELRAAPGNARAIRFWQKALPLLGARGLNEERDETDIGWRFESVARDR